MSDGNASPEFAAVRRVLVVDDDVDIGRLLGLRLRARGYEIELASSGEEALAKIAALPPDVMFLDVSMPGIGGLEVLTSVRKRGLDLGVVMTTAFGSEKVAIDALRHGADDYLRKPFEPHEFQAVLDRTVGKLQLSRQNAALRQLLDEKRRELEAEVARAAKVQADLLPRSNPTLPGLDIAARCLPSRDVGGDFYDWATTINGSLVFTVGDVMGKGMPAALLMATTRATLRALSYRQDPATAMMLAQKALYDDLDAAGSYVTLFHAHVDSDSDVAQVRFVDAGHGHAFIRRTDGSVGHLEPRGGPLGILPDERYVEGDTYLESGELLVIYSDGLIDARPDLRLEPTVLADYLIDVPDAQSAVDCLCDLARRDASQMDDLTVVVIRRRPSGG